MSNNSAGHVAAAIFISMYDTYKKESDLASRDAIIRVARKAWLEQWECGADYDTYCINEYGHGIHEALEGLGLARNVPNEKYPDEFEPVYYGEPEWDA